MWNLRQLVDSYVALAGAFGNPVELAQFQLSAEKTVSVLGGFDEDYHISRFLHFSNHPGGKPFLIGGEQVTHLSIDASISEIL